MTTLQPRLANLTAKPCGSTKRHIIKIHDDALGSRHHKGTKKAAIEYSDGLDKGKAKQLDSHALLAVQAPDRRCTLPMPEAPPVTRTMSLLTSFCGQ